MEVVMEVDICLVGIPDHNTRVSDVDTIIGWKTGVDWLTLTLNLTIHLTWMTLMLTVMVMNR